MKKLILILSITILTVVGFAFWFFQSGEDAAAESSLIPLLSEEAPAGFAKATEPNAIQFPRDFGPHNEYQLEWWYYTGNLATERGEQFGYQLTFFRFALTPPDTFADTNSDWRTNQVYQVHFTITDGANGDFYPHERISRGAAGLAGAQAVPYRVWVGDWYAEEIAPDVVQLYASSEDVTLDIELRQSLPPILHGNGGLSPKGEEPGNASYYYSLIHQPTVGRISIGDQTFEVAGESWKDHEYSTSALTGSAVGWDWFSIQLDDGSGLMFFEIRNRDGSVEPFSSGTFIGRDGSVTPLSLGDWSLGVTDEWRSPETGITYPAGWEISVPEFGIELIGRPLINNQELTVSTTYWEGAVEYQGSHNGAPLAGRGYVEMTGYE